METALFQYSGCRMSVSENNATQGNNTGQPHIGFGLGMNQWHRLRDKTVRGNRNKSNAIKQNWLDFFFSLPLFDLTPYMYRAATSLRESAFECLYAIRNCFYG